MIDNRNELLRAAQPLYDSDGLSILGNRKSRSITMPASFKCVTQAEPDDGFPDTVPLQYDRIERPPRPTPLPKRLLKGALIVIASPFIAIALAAVYFGL